MANYINENSVILTEEDAEEFMSEYYLAEGYIVLEGQQAEEYLRKKKEAKEKSDEEIEADEDRGSRRGQYYLDRNGDAQFNNYNKNSDNNPKFKTAREIENHRRMYGDVMPKKKSKSEEEISKVREKEKEEKMYAHNTLGNRTFKSLDDMNSAADAARRHYRRTHKNEASIFEQIEFI